MAPIKTSDLYTANTTSGYISLTATDTNTAYWDSTDTVISNEVIGSKHETNEEWLNRRIKEICKCWQN